MAIVIKISGVSKSFRGKPVLQGIDLEAKSGDIIGLVGKSGCGKSTLLKVLVGHYKPDKGSIFLGQQDVLKDAMAIRRMVGYTTQENSFYEKLSVAENMLYYSLLYGMPLRTNGKNINNILAQVGLLDHKNTLSENISGGMKRRLDFAISLIHDPSILILDEPTAGLDPLLIDQFWKIVKNIAAKQDKIVIVSSHILPEIETYCTKAAFMKDGKILKVLSGQKMKGLEQKFRKVLG